MIGIDRPEFSRPMTLAAAARQSDAIDLAADGVECAALARRFGLPEIDRLAASLSLRVVDDAVHATGTIAAALTQSCAATGEPIAVTIAEPFALRFEPEPSDVAEEVEVDSADCDVLYYEGEAIDLGEAVAQTLLLSLDPYPRIAEADAVLRAKGVKSEEEGGAFGALAALRDTFGKT